uniref:SRCR domain-containing protein n=1 Tax=Poecilia latipinna TaxID=48699 RepID=A0A3B3VVE4_9TELE
SFFLGNSIRLSASDKPCSGRVEIYHNGSWGTVCDDLWDLNDAVVACRQLDCGPALGAPQSAHFGQGTGQIWLDDVSCSGSESSLAVCGHRGFGTHNCGHGEDAGVICSGKTAYILYVHSGNVKLAGSARCSGRVEIYNSGSWGTVCNDNWDINDARVVCRQLACGTAVSLRQFAVGTGQIWLDEVACTGNENYLTECSHSGFGVHNCAHSQDAGVICSDNLIRLSGSNEPCSGRVEIYYNGVWGTVCDDGWDLNDAAVACRQLGCGPAKEAKLSAFFGQGTGQIWLDDVACSGSETSLAMCGHRGFGTHNCEHHEDAGSVWSQTGPNNLIRLSGSNEPCSGRVEIYHNGVWGTVCDDLWDLNDAAVACRQLDCGSALGAPQSAHFGQGTGQIWLDDLVCSGNEFSLGACGHNGFGTHNCVHGEDAGVICSSKVVLFTFIVFF